MPTTDAKKAEVDWFFDNLQDLLDHDVHEPAAEGQSGQVIIQIAAGILQSAHLYMWFHLPL